MLVSSFFKLTFFLISEKVGLAVILLFQWKKMETFWSGLVICVCYECLKSMVREVMHLSAVEHFQKTQPAPFLLCFLKKNINPIAVKTEAKCQFASRQYPSVVCIAATEKIHCQRHLLIDEVRALILCNGFSAFPFYSCLPWKQQSYLQVTFLSDIDEPSKFAGGQCQFEHKHLILVDKNRKI